MGAFTYIETDTGTNVDISAATAVGAYTSTGDKLIMVDVSIDAVAGNGDYVMYVTRQIGGSGSAYRILPQTTMTAASGLTAISGQSGWITVRNGDVLTCYVDGLAGDTSTPDWTTRWFELAGVTASAIADAVLDEATADHTSAGSLSKAVADILTDTGTTLDGKIDTIDTNVDSILADTGTDGVKIASGELSTVATASSITALDGKIDTIDNFLDTEVAAILADTNELQAELADGGRTDLLIDAIKAKTDTIAAAPTAASVADAVWDEAIADHTSVGSFGAKNQKVVPSETINDYKADVSGLATAAALDAVDNYIDTEVAAIKAKTDLIPAAPAQAGEYTAAIAAIPTTAPDNAGITAIKAKTDNLPASPANEATLTAIKGAGWTDETLVSLQTAVEAIDVSGVADAVWDEALAGHAAVGSAGAGLAAAGSAGDPWSTALPGAYGAGSAGLALSDILAKTDQLDVSSTSFVTAVVGSTITILRGDTFSGDLPNLGSLASYVTLDFTVKRSSQEADDDAIIRIRKNATGLTDGLVRLNGAAYTTGTDGSITITDAPTGDITIMLKAAVTDDLVPGSYVYDIQLIEAAGVTTLTTGGLVVTADVTRLVA